jgi:hypothetical protein
VDGSRPRVAGVFKFLSRLKTFSIEINLSLPVNAKTGWLIMSNCQWLNFVSPTQLTKGREYLTTMSVKLLAASDLLVQSGALLVRVYIKLA